MVTVHNVEVQVSKDQLLEAAGQLNDTDLSEFLTKVALLQARRRAPSLSHRETELVSKIYEKLPDEIQCRYDFLIEKQQTDSLQPDEREDFGQLITQVEQAEVRRVQALVELAQLWGISMPELLKRLGIKPKIYGI